MNQLVKRTSRKAIEISCTTASAGTSSRSSAALTNIISRNFVLGNPSSDKNTSTTTAPPFQLPDPTWSVADLELSKQHEPVSDDYLHTLARRALLDLDQLDPAARQQLRQDLGNMMHMIEQVQSFQHNSNYENSDLDEAAIYDKPRGVSAAPLRDDSDSSGAAAAEQQLEEMSQKVFDTFLKPKTTKVGAYNYFSIETKREDGTKS